MRRVACLAHLAPNCLAYESPASSCCPHGCALAPPALALARPPDPLHLNGCGGLLALAPCAPPAHENPAFCPPPPAHNCSAHESPAASCCPHPPALAPPALALARSPDPLRLNGCDGLLASRPTALPMKAPHTTVPPMKASHPLPMKAPHTTVPPMKASPLRVALTGAVGCLPRTLRTHCL